MAKKQSKSRLSETDFSVHNLRDAYISKQAEYVRDIRDEALFSNYGIQVLVRVPIYDDGTLAVNNVDEYSNFVNVNWQDTVESVIPKFMDYHEHVSEDGQQMDGIDGLYPLEILIPSKLFLPRDSRIILNEYDAKDQRIAREWKVLSTRIKQLSGSKTYTQIAACVPARDGLYNDIDSLYEGVFYFDVSRVENTIKEKLKAQGIFWFLRNGVDETKIRKGYANDIYEQTLEYPNYLENIDFEQFYSNETYQIINPGKLFEKGEIFDVLDENDEPVLIDKDFNGIKTPLKLRVDNVDEDGAITEFSLNIVKGFDYFPENFVITLRNKNDEIAQIQLISVNISDGNYYETLNIDDIPAPKYAEPKKVTILVSAKSVALSVLN